MKNFEIEPQYANFLDFISFVEHSPSHLDYSPILANLKVPISSLPSNEEVLNQYKANFLFKSSPLRISPKKKWKFEESMVFVWAVGSYSLLNKRNTDKFNKDDWTFIANMFPSMSPDRCKFKWKSIQKSIVQTNEWSEQEDTILALIIQNKIKFKDSYKWTEIAHELNQNSNEVVRLGKHCRERWYNHLDPNMKKGEWSLEEDLYILEAIIENGKKWAKISKTLEGRTENAVKNRFITLVRHYNKVNNNKKKREKSNPLDTPPEIIRNILNTLSNSLPDSPLKQRKMEEQHAPYGHDYLNSPYSSPMSEFGDEIDEQHKMEEEEEMKIPLSPKIPCQDSKAEERQLIRLQEVKAMDSCASLFEENKKSFESSDSDFKRINRMKSSESPKMMPMESPKMMPAGISPINFNNHTNESIPNLDSHLDISPNVNYPAFSKISEKSQEDMPSMEFLEDKMNKEIKKNSIAHSNTTPINNETNNRSYFERMLQRFNSNSKNVLDNSYSAQLFKTHNSFYSAKSKLSLERSFGIENLTEENILPFLLQHEQLKNHQRTTNLEGSPVVAKKMEEKTQSPIINSLNNLNLSDSPKLLSPPDVLRNLFNKSGSLEAGREESFMFSKKDSCSNFLNLDKTELMNSMLKNLEEE